MTVMLPKLKQYENKTATCDIPSFFDDVWSSVDIGSADDDEATCQT